MGRFGATFTFFFSYHTKATFEFSCILNKASVRALSLDLIIVPWLLCIGIESHELSY